ncbi:zeta toxin family protein [Williamsia sp. SKLECPSW1]
MGSDPVLHLLVGPNGSGRSTLFDYVLGPTTHLPFVNADLIARDRWSGDELAHAYDAAALAADERQQFITERRSFIAETVFSHPSKVEFVRDAVDAGYLVTLHVVVVPVDLTVARVINRVEVGGHAVPEMKVRERYERLWPLVRQTIDLVEQAVVYDNSAARDPFRVLARFDRGRLVGAPRWPEWTPSALRT